MKGMAIGNSHLEALRWADDNGLSSLEKLTYYALMAPEYQPYWTDEPGSRRLNSLFASRVREAIQREAPDFILCFTASNFAFYAGCVNHPRSFDFVIPNCADSIDGNVEIVPLDAMALAANVEAKLWVQILTLAKEASGAAIWSICCPPPPADLAPFVPKMSEHLQERIASHGIANKSFRRKMWLLQATAEHGLAASCGVPFMLAPSDTLDDDGFLLQELCHDGLHAGLHYGKAVLTQIAREVGSKEMHIHADASV
jgi:hypothetical protein